MEMKIPNTGEVAADCHLLP